jgi:hypothetical protein
MGMEPRDWLALASLGVTLVSLGVTALIASQHKDIKIAVSEGRLEISELRGEVRERIARMEGAIAGRGQGGPVSRLVNGKP